MEEHVVRILHIEQLTHDVKRFQIEKPDGYSFIPGQATEVSVNKPELANKKGPFTFTCLNSDHYLEFTIKIYPQRQGKTNEIGKLNVGEELIIRDVWGTISYKGKGVFIAGGAGITPFIAIIRDLQSKNEIGGNKLLFANKTKADIILEEEFKSLFGKDFVNILADEQIEGYSFGMMDEAFFKANISDFSQNFYLCGPPPMMNAVIKLLKGLGVTEEAITMERF
jgi:ferredoxin-NADP reductase